MRNHLRPRRLASNLLVLALLGLWFLTLAPTAIGGPAAYIEVSGHSMDGTYKTGDLILTRTETSYKVGDIIVYRVHGAQVIHRIIGGDGTHGFTTKGDNNPDPDPWHPRQADVVGKARLRLPGTAWITHLPAKPWFVGLTAGLSTLVALGVDSIPRRRKDRETADAARPELTGARS